MCLAILAGIGSFSLESPRSPRLRFREESMNCGGSKPVANPLLSLGAVEFFHPSKLSCSLLIFQKDRRKPYYTHSNLTIEIFNSSRRLTEMSIGALVKKWATGAGTHSQFEVGPKPVKSTQPGAFLRSTCGHSGDIDLRYYECALFIVTSAAQSVKVALIKVCR
jgi:hypothetical protein